MSAINKELSPTLLATIIPIVTINEPIEINYECGCSLKIYPDRLLFHIHKLYCNTVRYLISSILNDNPKNVEFREADN